MKRYPALLQDTLFFCNTVSYALKLIFLIPHHEPNVMYIYVLKVHHER
uniref:Uncharacterized protein n=1 Tax=Arundo donax TaxID=35708 RepID=A0A0A9AEX0_ARUDO